MITFKVRDGNSFIIQTLPISPSQCFHLYNEVIFIYNIKAVVI